MDRDPSILLTGAYASATVRKYNTAVDRFIDWCNVNQHQPHSTSQLDRYLSEYFVELWFTIGKSAKAEASCTFYGLDMFLPGIRRKLDRSRRSLRGLSRLAPSVPRPPLPWTIAIAIAVWLAQHNKPQMSIAIVLSFDCYLRSGELINLKREDIADGLDSRLGLRDANRMHLHLRQTKTDKNQGVEVKDRQVMNLVRTLIFSTPVNEKLFPFSKSTYRRWFHRACDALRLSPDYVPHSLRHGGATRDYLNGTPINDVMVRGRWAVTKSATHYIQQGRQLMMLQQVPPEVDFLGRIASADLEFFLLSSYSLSQSIKTRAGTTLS